MKRFICGVILCMLFACGTVLAGDLPEALITYENGDLFIGEIIDISDGTTTIEVHHALFENYDIDMITIDSFMYMGLKTPMVGDFVAIPAEYDENNSWKVVFSDDSFYGLIAKSDSLDPKTLTLDGGGDTSMIKRMNDYINDGTYSKEHRKKLLAGRESAAEQSEVAEDNIDEIADKIAVEAKGEIDEVAQNTQIVTSVPEALDNHKGQKSGKLMDNPYVRYPFITLSSMGISYFISKRVRAKRSRKKT